MYHLIGQLDDSENHAREPFPEPATGATITFWQGNPMTLYSACLVKVASVDGHTLTFYGVDTRDETPNTSKLHSVDLRDSEMVWPCEPTSNWKAVTNTNNYLVLLLKSKFVNDEPTLTAAKAEDGGKWPRSAAEKLVKLEKEYGELIERVRRLHTMLDENSQKNVELLFSAYL
jgi:hypothetical protein